MLVMKFKGAVLQNQETLAEVKNRIKEQNCCSIVVVSALKGVMPRLRQLYGLSLRRGTGFENEFNELKQVHEQLAYELLAGRKLDEYKVELQKELESCRAARQEFRGLRGMAVVPGYCGKTEAGYTISMGRVGLSLTAAVLEAAFQQVKVA